MAQSPIVVYKYLGCRCIVIRSKEDKILGKVKRCDLHIAIRRMKTRISNLKAKRRAKMEMSLIDNDSWIEVSIKRYTKRIFEEKKKLGLLKDKLFSGRVI